MKTYKYCKMIELTQNIVKFSMYEYIEQPILM